MGFRRCRCAVVLALTLAVTSSTRAASPAQIRRSIERAKTYLYDQQSKDHTWEIDYGSHGDQKTGQTALCVYALLSAGESRQDPRLLPAIEYLKKTDTTGVYALGVRCQIWLMLQQSPDVRAAMLKDANVLLKSIKRTGDGKGFYDYNSGGKNYSHSRAQYAVLGLWAAAQSGIDVPREYWQLVQKSWVDHQDASGGWNYVFKESRYPITPGMTAVGVATLFIADEQLASLSRSPAIDRGMKWMIDNFAKVASEEKYPRAYPYATLYAIERIGVASGTKYFGQTDWYDKGADYALSHQKSDGSFPFELEGKTASTCFAMLFLSRGSCPLVMNKLDYSAAFEKDAHWNQRPRDVSSVARWTGKQIEHELNWQIVNLDSPLEDLLDAQILYLAGNQDIRFKPEHDAKLKAFIEAGGLIVANADSAAAVFANSIKSLGKRLFPAYEFVPLPDSHPIYTNQQFHRTDWKRKPALQSMSNGAREFIILMSDTDPGKTWQGPAAVGREESFQLAADLFLYSVDKQNLRRRGEGYLVTRDEKVQATRSIKLARIEYDGNADPEPGGWRRIAALMHNADKVDLVVEPVKIDALTSHKLAHLTGTGKVALTPAQRESIKAFLEAGGALIIDAAGGSSAFAESIEKELAAIIPDAKEQLAQALPPEHPIYKDVKTIGYRNFARARLGLLKSAQLRGIKVKDRLAVIYSREDLSVGLVGQPIDGIVGYDPATATALMRSILLTQGSPK